MAQTPPAPPAASRGPSLRRRLVHLGLAVAVLLLVGEWAVRAFDIERLSCTNPELYVPAGSRSG